MNNITCIGHSVWFFKKTSDLDSPIENGFFDFLTFGNFDGGKVYNVETIKDFSNNRVRLECSSERDVSYYCAHCERQILNLLKLEKNIGESICTNKNCSNWEKCKEKYSIFSKDCQNSVIATFLMTSYSTNDVIGTEVLGEILDTEIDVRYEIFNILSSEDRIIVFRSNSVKRIFEAVSKIKSVDDNKCVNFHTLPGVYLDKDGKICGKWEEGINANASIRLHILPTSFGDEFIERLQNDESFCNLFDDEKPPKFVQTMGKNYITLDFPMKHTQAFVDLFRVDGYFNSCKKDNANRAAFISSSTVFQSQIEPLNRGGAGNWSYISNSEETWIKLLENVKDIRSDIIKRAAVVLAERVHLIKHSMFSHKYYKTIYDFTTHFLSGLANKDLGGEKDRNDILEQIACIDLFIENIYSYSYRDFECPQRDIRIIVDAGKFLLLYTKFAEMLLPKNQKILVVPNINEDIQALPDPNTNTFIAKIPEKSIFDINTNLLLICHEIGHHYESEVCKLKALREYVLYWFVNDVCRFYYYKKITSGASQGVFSEGLAKYIRFKLENVKAEFYDNVEEYHEKYFRKLIAECIKKTIEYTDTKNGLIDSADLKNVVEKLDSDEARKNKCFDYVENYPFDYISAFGETLADMYMKHILGIKDFKDYIEFLLENYKEAEAGANESICIRILAVYLYYRIKENKDEKILERLRMLPDATTREIQSIILNHLEDDNIYIKNLKEKFENDKKVYRLLMNAKTVYENIEYSDIKKCKKDETLVDSFKFIQEYHKPEYVTDDKKCKDYLVYINELFKYAER